MRMIRVTQHFDNYCDPHDHGEAFFECVTTARNYARTVEQQGKSVTMSVVALQHHGIHVVQTIQPEEHVVCVACLSKEKPCNIATVQAQESSRKLHTTFPDFDNYASLSLHRVASMR